MNKVMNGWKPRMFLYEYCEEAWNPAWDQTKTPEIAESKHLP